MTHPLRRLGRSALVGLAEALSAGRLAPPFGRAAVAALVPDAEVAAVLSALEELSADGMAPRHIARTLALLAEERAAYQQLEDRVQLVWSPPELDQVDARDTGVVVAELFRAAAVSVRIVSFALDEGAKAEVLFGELAARMDAEPALDVRVYANIHRKHLDETPAPVLVRQFAARLRGQIWPGQRLPQVFYDPRSLEIEHRRRAVLHAKCVVVDQRWTFLTSANFTEAAQVRNIEAGVLLDDRRVAERVQRQLDALVEIGVLKGG